MGFNPLSTIKLRETNKLRIMGVDAFRVGIVRSVPRTRQDVPNYLKAAQSSNGKST